MSTKKRSESGPSIEELFSRLEKRLIEYEDKTEKKFNGLEEQLKIMSQKLEIKREFLDEMSEKKNNDSQEKLNSLFEKVYSQDREMDEIKEKFGSLNTDVSSFKDKIDNSTTMIDDIEEKMYDFEISKKNNLIFYGIPASKKETRNSLTQTIQDIIHINHLVP